MPPIEPISYRASLLIFAVSMMSVLAVTLAIGAAWIRARRNQSLGGYSPRPPSSLPNVPAPLPPTDFPGCMKCGRNLPVNGSVEGLPWLRQRRNAAPQVGAHRMSDGLGLVKFFVRCGAVFVAVLLIVAAAMTLAVMGFLYLERWSW